MHEFALAEALIEQVGRLAQGQPPVLEVELQVGELTAVNAEALRMAFDALAQDLPGLRGASLLVQSLPVVLGCRDCGAEGEPPDPLYLVCSACGSASVDLRSGRELDIVRIRVADEADSEEGPCTTS